MYNINIINHNSWSNIRFYRWPYIYRPLQYSIFIYKYTWPPHADIIGICIVSTSQRCIYMCVTNGINNSGVKSLKMWLSTGCSNSKCYVIGKATATIYVLIYIINRCITIYNNKTLLRYSDASLISRSLDLERKSSHKAPLDQSQLLGH